MHIELFNFEKKDLIKPKHHQKNEQEVFGTVGLSSNTEFVRIKVSYKDLKMMVFLNTTNQ